MSEPNETVARAAPDSRLADAVREVKNALADRDDVVVDIREAQRTRLELLADDLQPVFADIPADDERFDLAISAGTQPRLWIDCVAHVTMARDRRTYRFLRDTRLGRVVMAESADIRQVAAQVTRYIAERVIERDRALAGDVAQFATADVDLQDEEAPRRSGWGAFAGAVGVVLLGGIVGVGVIMLFAWGELGSRF